MDCAPRSARCAAIRICVRCGDEASRNSGASSAPGGARDSSAWASRASPSNLAATAAREMSAEIWAFESRIRRLPASSIRPAKRRRRGSPRSSTRSDRRRRAIAVDIRVEGSACLNACSDNPDAFSSVHSAAASDLRRKAWESPRRRARLPRSVWRFRDASLRRRGRDWRRNGFPSPAPTIRRLARRAQAHRMRSEAKANGRQDADCAPANDNTGEGQPPSLSHIWGKPCSCAVFCQISRRMLTKC